MMLLTIENFGPIKKFEYDLSKDLIVTYGGNNIGKSYAMQVAYLFLKSLYNYAEQYAAPYAVSANSIIPFAPMPPKDTLSYQKIKAFVQEFSEGTEESVSLLEFINKVGRDYVYDVLSPSFIKSCENTFDNFDKIRASLPTIKLEIDKGIIFLLSFKSIGADSLHLGVYTARRLTDPIVLKRSKPSGTSNSTLFEWESSPKVIYYAGDIDKTSTLIAQYANIFPILYATTILEFISPVYFLPASRSGLYLSLSTFGAMYAQAAMQRGVFGNNLPLAAIPEPIADYFLSLSSIRKTENQEFSDIYGKIEHDILKGIVRFDENKLVYKADGLEYPLEMTQVSSMVAEVSPIVAFLKYVLRKSVNAAPPSDSDKKTSPRPTIFFEEPKAHLHPDSDGKTLQPRPTIFIEEPEAHLHPENQIKLAELFAHLHESGVRLVMSSHSNYLFNKFNNLLLSGELTPDVYSAIVLKEDGDGKSVSTFMETDELGVDDTNFMDAAQSLYNEREELIEKLNGWE